MTQQSLITTMAGRYNMDPLQFARTIRATVMPSDHTDEQFAAFMMVAHQYDLNPVTREIYAYPGRKGGINPVVSIDGWIHLVNSHPQCDGFDFAYVRDDTGKLVGVTCTIHRKDRTKPTVVTEFLSECYRNTEPWNQMPARMLRHKAFKEAARLAFGFAGIADEDEAREIAGSAVKVEQPPAAGNDDVIMKALGQFASGRVSSNPPAASTATDEGGGEGAQHSSAAADESSATPGFSAGEGGDETPHPPASPSSPPQDPDRTLRNEAIAEALQIASRSDLEDRLDRFDALRLDLLDRLSAHPVFVKTLIETAAKVANKQLPKAAAAKYLASLKD